MSKRVQKRQERKRVQPKVDWKALAVVHPDAAGIDIGGSEHWVAVGPDRDEQPVRCFDCFTADLEQMADWLAARGVRSVAMQSTGVYWIPVFEVLQQRGMEVYLVNARHTKNLPGRKSDIAECQWLLKLHTFGLLQNSFQPSDEIRAVRTLWRYRGGLVGQASSTIQRMQKALIEMNIQLSNVLSDLSGVSGMAIVQAILEGKRDPQELAALADPQVKASQEVIAKSLPRQLAVGIAVCAGPGDGQLPGAAEEDRRVRWEGPATPAADGVEGGLIGTTDRFAPQGQTGPRQCSPDL